MSASISGRSDQCKVHVVLVQHSSVLYFPRVSGEDNAETLVYIVPYNWPIPSLILQECVWLLDNFRDSFVLYVSYDMDKVTRQRAFQRRPTQVVEYYPAKGA